MMHSVLLASSQVRKVHASFRGPFRMEDAAHLSRQVRGRIHGGQVPSRFGNHIKNISSKAPLKRPHSASKAAERHSHTQTPAPHAVVLPFARVLMTGREGKRLIRIDATRRCRRQHV